MDLHQGTTCSNFDFLFSERGVSDALASAIPVPPYHAPTFS